jgi:hypothetical protein
MEKNLWVDIPKEPNAKVEIAENAMRYFFFSYAYYGNGTQGTGNIYINCLQFPPLKSVVEEIQKNSKHGIIDVVISGWQEMSELDFQQANSLT